VYLALVADHESQLRLFGAVRSFERALGGAERREGLFHMTLMVVSEASWNSSLQAAADSEWARLNAGVGDFVLSRAALDTSEIDPGGAQRRCER